MKDLKGKKFGRLTVLNKSNKKIYGRYGWDCICDCGEAVVVDTTGLISGRKKSCGCYQKEVASKKRKEVTHTTSIKEALYSRFDVRPNGCWEWNSRKDKDGYGIVMLNGKNIRGHRLSFSYHNKISLEKISSFSVCHKCDNPSCVNPSHLFLGTSKDNAIDARNKGRAYIGEKNNRSKLKEFEVKKILKDNRTHKEIAKNYNVSRALISAIKRREIWKNL